MKGIYAVLPVCGLISACSPGALSPDYASGQILEMPLAQNPLTRAHFEDRDDTATFVWDADSRMIAAACHGGSLVQWTGGGFFSPMNISHIDPEDSHKVLRAYSSLTMPGDAAEVEDPLFFLSPVNGSDLCLVEASSENLSVVFSMPSTFSQTATKRLEEFEDYCLIHGESTVLSVPSASDKNFAAKSTTFAAVPATFRFNVTNNTDQDVRMESVKISCDKGFPDKLCWICDGTSASMAEPGDKSGYFKLISTSINHGFGETIAAKDAEDTSTGTYYAMCLPFDADSSMDGATLAFILETSEKTHTFNLPASQFFRDAASKRFESNKIYTFNFTMNNESVELEGVTISDWVGDPFYLPTEEISAFLVVRPSYWNQDRENLNTYGFVKMNSTETNYTMWGECNVGEYLAYSTETTFNWSEVTPADASDTDYLSGYFHDITDFKWETPARDDFTALFNVAEENIEMCIYEESGVSGVKIYSESNPGGYIFLPVSVVEDAGTIYPDTGETIIPRYCHGYYWTRDGDETDDAKAYLFHFEFKQVETIDINGTSTFSFSKVLDEGNDIYEFQTASKQENHTVRAILHYDI
ncbi:MAG: fimbrillin family protein [Candidatus Cryptobacteroides sp.]